MSSFKAFPDGWDVTEIKDANITIIDGDRGENYPTKDEFSAEGFCLFLNTGNIKADVFDFTVCDFISERKDALLRKGKLARKDNVLTTRGTVGSVAYYHDGVRYDHIRINSGMVILRCGKGLAPEYFYQLLKSPILKTQYQLFSSGAAQPQLPIKDLRRIKLPIPQPHIQKKIAAILSAYDDLIENNRRRIALLEKMAEELYREWFVRMRFPGHDKVKKVKGVPEGWEIQKIGQIYNTSSGGTPSREVGANYDGEICWAKTGELKSTFVLDTEEKITQQGLENSSAKVYPRHTVVIAMYCAMPDISILAVDSATNQACCAFFPKMKHLHYTYNYFLLKFAQRHLINFAHGAAQQNLSQELIKGFPLLIPEKHLIEAFSKTVAPLFSEVEHLMRSNVCLRKTRDILLPRLISGKLSVADLDIQFPPSMQEEPSPQPSPSGRGSKVVHA